MRLLLDTDHAAGWAAASVTGRLALLVSALAQVISSGVHDDGAL